MSLKAAAPGEGEILDCLIIGDGPAGLTAAIYLARYRRSVAVFCEGKSRASYIPKSHNYPGFPAGISGSGLTELLNKQANFYGVSLTRSRITRLEKSKSEFQALHKGGMVWARTVLLATGLIDKAPPIADLEKAVTDGLIRYCPVCDESNS